MASRLLLPNILLSRRVLPLLPPPLSRLDEADCPGGCNGDVAEVDGDEDIDGDGDEAGDDGDEERVDVDEEKVDGDEEKVDGVTVGRMQLPLREAVVASPARSSSLC